MEIKSYTVHRTVHETVAVLARDREEAEKLARNAEIVGYDRAVSNYAIREDPPGPDTITVLQPDGSAVVMPWDEIV